MSATTTACPSREQGHEGFDEVAREVRELCERFEKRLTFDNLAIAERYLNGELRIILLLGVVGPAPHLDDVECCAVFERELPICGSNPDRGEDGAGRELHLHDDAAVGGPDDIQDPVLVVRVETVQTPEGVVPSLVRLGRLNSCLGLGTDSLYASRQSGLKRLRASGDREHRLVGGLPPVREYELPDKMVEGRSEVVDGVSGEEAPSWVRLFTNSYAPDEIARIRIFLSDNQIGVAVIESGDARFEIRDVLFGPFDFQPRRVNAFDHVIHGFGVHQV